jgi:hypothetical protein
MPVGKLNDHPESLGIKSFKFCIPCAGLHKNAMNPDHPTTCV